MILTLPDKYYYDTNLKLLFKARSSLTALRFIGAVKNDVPYLFEDVEIVEEDKVPYHIRSSIARWERLRHGPPWEMPFEKASEVWGVTEEEHLRFKEILTVVAKVADYLFHKDIFIPDEVINYLDGSEINLTPSNHALDKLIYIYYDKGVDIPPEFISRPIVLKRDGIIEVGFDRAGNLVHVLYREPYDDRWDIVYAIKLPDGLVKTVFVNERTDIHKTLDVSRYASPNRWRLLKPTFELLYK